MPARWILFAIVNYLLLIIYGFLLLGAMRFSTENAQAGESMGTFSFFFAGLFIIVLNSILNIYIFHKHLPDRPFSERLKITHKIFSFIFLLGWLMMMILFLNEITSFNYNRDTYLDREIVIGLLCLLFFTFAAGLFVLVSQFQARKFIEERSNINNNENPS